MITTIAMNIPIHMTPIHMTRITMVMARREPMPQV